MADLMDPRAQAAYRDATGATITGQPMPQANTLSDLARQGMPQQGLQPRPRATPAQREQVIGLLMARGLSRVQAEQMALTMAP